MPFTRRRGMVALALGLLSTAAQAHDFVNLDFESAVVVGDDIFQPWETALPGWQHSAGNDTEIVYWRVAHVGASQLYLLREGPLPGLSEGHYGVSFHSGIERGSDLESPWIQAYLAQTGEVPLEARSIRLTGEGFSLTLDGEAVPLTQIAPLEYMGDVTRFAGRTVELRVSDAAPAWTFNNASLDGIRFSAQPVPEPGTLAMALTGLAVVGTAVVGRRHGNPGQA